MADTPKSYADPLYASIAADVERRQGLPTGLLHSIINYGERSNADQVSEAGARTVAQITPPTRKAAIDKYGIDPYISPQNALEVAGRLLKDSLARNDGDTAAAIGEYHGGTDRKNWGPRTQAYINRVSAGQQGIKTAAMGADFAKWMAANPATPEPGTAAPAAPATDKPLDQGFAQWLSTQSAPSSSGADAIPGQSGEVVSPQPVGEKEPQTLAEKLKAAGKLTLDTVMHPVQSVMDATETGMGVLSGLTTGAAGAVTGAAGGAADVIGSGKFGTPEGAAQIAQASAQGADNLTYSPRSPAAQQAVETIGKGLQEVLPAGPVMAGIAGTARPAASTATGAVRTAAQEALRMKVEQAAARRAQASSPQGTPTPGTMGSVGAAGTDISTLRRTAAQDLPVPIDLTKGQATRDFEQLRFEREMAKDPTKGQPLRDFGEEQNARALRNFDVFVDETGAQKVDPVAVGDSVTRALRERAAADKTRIRVAYKNAEKAGAMEAPVSMENVVSYLNEAAPDAATAPLVDTARKWAVKLGIAEEGADGALVPAGGTTGSFLMNDRKGAGAVNLKTAETFRQAINRNTDFEPTNIRQATILKGLVDEATEGIGGEAYRQARLLRRQYAERYENFGLARDLLNNKRGMSDAIVPAEKVFQKAVLSAPMSDVKQIGRLLKSGGEPGRQAWAELQGAAVRYIRDEATKNVARDARGNSIVSPAGLDKAVKQLDSAGKLDYMFGRKGAEQLRAINDLAKDIYTAPPGAVNHSNTASVILAALDMATSGIAGMPLPVMSGLRILTTHVRDRKIQHRINDALGIKPEPKKVKAPMSIVPRHAPSDPSRAPSSRTVH